MGEALLWVGGIVGIGLVLGYVIEAFLILAFFDGISDAIKTTKPKE